MAATFFCTRDGIQEELSFHDSQNYAIFFNSVISVYEHSNGISKPLIILKYRSVPWLALHLLPAPHPPGPHLSPPKKKSDFGFWKDLCTSVILHSDIKENDNDKSDENDDNLHNNDNDGDHKSGNRGILITRIPILL